MSTIKNEDTLIVAGGGDIQSQAIKKHSPYFSNCCYFSTTSLKHSIYCLDTGSTAEKTIMCKVNENKIVNDQNEVSEFSKNLFEGEDTCDPRQSNEYDNSISSKKTLAQKPHIIFNNDPQNHNKIIHNNNEGDNKKIEVNSPKDQKNCTELTVTIDQINNDNILRPSSIASSIIQKINKNHDHNTDNQCIVRISNISRIESMENCEKNASVNLQNTIIQPFIDSPEFVKIESKNFIQSDEALIDPISKQSMIEIENPYPSRLVNKKDSNKKSEGSKHKSEDSISLEGSSFDANSQDKISALDLDLSNLQLIEEKFSSIIEGINQGDNVSKFCKDWWSLTSNKGYTHIYVN